MRICIFFTIDWSSFCLFIFRRFLRLFDSISKIYQNFYVGFEQSHYAIANNNKYHEFFQKKLILFQPKNHFWFCDQWTSKNFPQQYDA